MSHHITTAVDALIASQDIEAITATIKRAENLKKCYLTSIQYVYSEEQAVSYAIGIVEITRGLARLRQALVC